MTRIFLTGYMCAGKTTLGKAFARETGLTFIDLDWYIESRYRKSVREIFAESGEEGFRLLEQRMLHEVGEFEDVIVSTGGGTPCFFDNMEYMNRQGQTVFLSATTEVLFHRLRIGKQQRPLLKDKSDEELRTYIDEALAKRMPFYSQARYCFDSNHLENRAEIGNSVKELQELLMCQCNNAAMCQ